MILQKIRTTLLKIEQAYRNAGASQAGARIKMAHQLGLGAGTLENLIRMRVKTVDADTAFNIQRLRLKTIEAEIAQLENERKLILEFRLPASPDEMDALETLLAEARLRLRKMAERC